MCHQSKELTTKQSKDIQKITNKDKKMSSLLEQNHPLIVESIRYFHKLNRPILLGELSLYVDVSLERSQRIVERLIDMGIVRSATEKELFSINASSKSFVYVLAVKRDLSLAYR